MLLEKYLVFYNWGLLHPFVFMFNLPRGHDRAGCHHPCFPFSPLLPLFLLVSCLLPMFGAMSGGGGELASWLQKQTAVAITGSETENA